MRRVVAAVVLLLLAGLPAGSAAASPDTGVVGPEHGAAGPAAPPGQVLADNDTANNSTGATFGASISSFMQSQAEQTGETVTHGMWTAAVGASNQSARPQLADRRVRQMRSTLANLTETRRSLVEARRAGEISAVEFRARMASIQARMHALSGSVESATETLERDGPVRPELAELQDDVRNASQGHGPPVGVPGVASAGDGGQGPASGNGSPGDGGPGRSGDAPGRNVSTGAGPPGVGGGAPGNGSDGPPVGDAPGNDSDGPPGNGGPPGSEGPPGDGGPSGGDGPPGTSDENLTDDALLDGPAGTADGNETEADDVRSRAGRGTDHADPDAGEPE